MSWKAVARKDFRDAIRSKMFWGLAVVFGLLAIGVGFLYGEYDVLRGASDVGRGYGLIRVVSTPVALFVTLTAVIISHKSIINERESGSIKLMLSLPHTRLDIVIGKIVGRTGVLAIPAIGSLIIGIAVGGAMIGTIPIVQMLVFLVSITVLIATYVSLVVGISAAVTSSSMATFLAVLFFIVVELLWSVLTSLIFGQLEIGSASTAYLFYHLAPSNASNAMLAIMMDAATDVPREAVAPFSEIGTFAELDAFYTTPWLGVVIIAFWLVVPAALGYRRFDNADL